MIRIIIVFLIIFGIFNNWSNKKIQCEPFTECSVYSIDYRTQVGEHNISMLMQGLQNAFNISPPTINIYLLNAISRSPTGRTIGSRISASAINIENGSFQEFTTNLSDTYSSPRFNICVHNLTKKQYLIGNYGISLNDAIENRLNRMVRDNLELDRIQDNIKWKEGLLIHSSHPDSKFNECFRANDKDLHVYGFFTNLKSDVIAGKMFSISQNGFILLTPSDDAFSNGLLDNKVRKSWLLSHEIGHTLGLKHGPEDNLCSDNKIATARQVDDVNENCFKPISIVENNQSRNLDDLHKEVIADRPTLPGIAYPYFLDPNNDYQRVYYSDVINKVAINSLNNQSSIENQEIFIGKLNYIELEVGLSKEKEYLYSNEFVKRMLYDLDFNLSIEDEIQFTLPAYQFNEQNISIDNSSFKINLPIFSDGQTSPFKLEEITEKLKPGENYNFQINIFEPNSTNEIYKFNDDLNFDLKINYDQAYEKHTNINLLQEIMSGYYPEETDSDLAQIEQITELLNDKDLSEDTRFNIYIGLQNYNNSPQMSNIQNVELKEKRFKKLCSDSNKMFPGKAYKHYKNIKYFNCN